MVDAALIQQCAAPGVPPAIIERFISAAGSSDPLAITVRSGSRAILITPPKTPDEAMALMQRHVGRAVVRVGITQYPAGVGINDVSQLTPDLVDACKNIRLGTALFGKVYRIVVKWYGRPVQEAFDDALVAWRTGTFEGQAVFTAEDPGPVVGPSPPAPERAPEAPPPEARPPERAAKGEVTSGPDQTQDPHRAGIRIDLSGIGATAAPR